MNKEVNYNYNLNADKNLVEPKEPNNNREFYDPYKEINNDFLIKNKYEDYFNDYDKDKRQKDGNSINNNILDNNGDIMDNYIDRNLMNKFNDFDLNKDNKLDNQEIMAGLNIPLDQANQFIKNYDLNGNGFLEQNEFNQIPLNELGFI